MYFYTHPPYRSVKIVNWVPFQSSVGCILYANPSLQGMHVFFLRAQIIPPFARNFKFLFNFSIPSHMIQSRKLSYWKCDWWKDWCEGTKYEQIGMSDCFYNWWINHRDINYIYSSRGLIIMDPCVNIMLMLPNAQFIWDTKIAQNI